MYLTSTKIMFETMDARVLAAINAAKVEMKSAATADIREAVDKTASVAVDSIHDHLEDVCSYLKNKEGDRFDDLHDDLHKEIDDIKTAAASTNTNINTLHDKVGRIVESLSAVDTLVAIVHDVRKDVREALATSLASAAAAAAPFTSWFGCSRRKSSCVEACVEA